MKSILSVEAAPTTAARWIQNGIVIPKDKWLIAFASKLSAGLSPMEAAQEIRDEIHESRKVP